MLRIVLSLFLLLPLAAHAQTVRIAEQFGIGYLPLFVMRDAKLLEDEGAKRGLLADRPEVRLPASEAARFLQGLRRRTALADAPAVRVYGPEAAAFLGSAHITAGELIADRLLSPPEVQALIQS